MSNPFESFAQKLAQEALKQTGELLIDLANEQVPLLKPALQALQNGTRRYPLEATQAPDKPKSNKSKTVYREKAIRDRLAAQLPGSRTEVSTPTGQIDILTASRVIEVKNVRHYKHAIGQVISYSYYYPKHERYIYLFGAVSAKQQSAIKKECSTAQVGVMFV
ncbi:MAG: hypothetical protein ACK5CA_03280 [Cyanobacteriota bacterium]